MNSFRSTITSPPPWAGTSRVGSAAIPDTKGRLLAWDPVHQKEAWHVEYLGPWNGGVLTTAGNLVVQGDAAGSLNVFRADSGEKLWSMPVQSAVMGGPSTYEVNGEQYIAVMAGWGGAFPLLEGKEAARSGNLRNLSRVLVFKVGGTAQLPPPPPEQKLVLNPPAATADAATVAAGRALFAQYCSVCHGESAVGGGIIPDLRASNFLGNDFWYEIVLNGAMKDAGMAPFKTVLDQERRHRDPRLCDSTRERGQDREHGRAQIGRGRHMTHQNASAKRDNAVPSCNHRNPDGLMASPRDDSDRRSTSIERSERRLARATSVKTRADANRRRGSARRAWACRERSGLRFRGPGQESSGSAF